MSVLTINCGSSSLKFSLYKTGKSSEPETEGKIEEIGNKNSNFSVKKGGIKVNRKIKITSHKEALKLVFKNIDKNNINLIVHRVVHGGNKYFKPTKVNAKVIKEIEKISTLAPLQNPVNIEGIKICKKILPNVKQAVVFDTSFYSSLDEKAYAYAIPKDLRTKYKIRKYGFHGTNHKFVTQKAMEIIGKKKPLKIISCHLGSGSSVTASIGGKAVETSMGFTPLDGLAMGTRCGSIDPSAALKIQEIKKLTPEQTTLFLNKQCGLHAVSEIQGGDMRDIYKSSLEGRERSLFTIDFISYQLAKMIGAYTAAMSGLDALIFTGAIGENAFYIREKTCNYLSHINLKLDKQKNKKCETLISTNKSKIKVLVIKANEELQMVKETFNKIK